ncbi:MAG: phosphodiesterase [Ruminococcaceae bacterium]|nr:phosphodiesterase [Oscillospiraceae bacterium]
MKLMIASDIHGDKDSCLMMRAAFEAERADKLLLLGDLLYHGPRNDLPSTYAPKEVIKILSAIKEHLICVRGNCDTEVDQTVLPFPMLSDTAFLHVDGIDIFAAHGHHACPDALPPLPRGCVFASGHTHIPLCTERDGILCLNPGSISLPRGGFPKSYMIFENRAFTAKSFDGTVIFEHEM